MGLDITAELLTQHPRARAAFRSWVQIPCFANGTMRPRAGTAVPSIQVLEEPRLLPKSPNSQRGAPSKVGQDQKAVGPGQLVGPRDTGLWRVRMNLDNVLKSVFPNGLMFSQMKSCAFSAEETSTVSKQVWCLPAGVWSRKEKASVHLCVRVYRCRTHCAFPPPRNRKQSYSRRKIQNGLLEANGGRLQPPKLSSRLWRPCQDFPRPMRPGLSHNQQPICHLSYFPIWCDL